MKYKIFLSLSLLIVIILFITTIILAINYLPQQAEIIFGHADSKLDLSQRLIYSVRLLASQNQLLGIGKQTDKPVEISIETGQTAEQVSKELFRQGLILNADALAIYLSYSGLDIRIRAGKYVINPGKNSIEISHLICDLTPDSVKFVILPGMRVEEIAAMLPTSGMNIGPDEFIQLVKNPPAKLLRKEIEGANSLEGVLYPDEYFFTRNTETSKFIETLIDRFFEKVPTELINGLNSNGLSLNQGIVLASIIQKERVTDEDGPKIASVFYNRLKSGMKLDSDATIQYSVGNSLVGWWKYPLVTQDFQKPSPFNTYANFGLPLTAICNPDIDSLQAAAFPEKTDYYFFQAKCDQSGRHDFFKTYEEQINHLCS
jgi:UPF0755 protein